MGLSQEMPVPEVLVVLARLCEPEVERQAGPVLK